MSLTNAVSISGQVLAMDRSSQNAIVVQALFENAVTQAGQPGLSTTASPLRGKESSDPALRNAGELAIRVALVEDDERLRGSLEMLVGGSPGFELIGSYADAELALKELPGMEPNVVLMDVNLPKPSGIECARKLKPRLPQTQIVILTVYQDEERVFNALRAGAVGYLAKDTPPGEILEAIQETHRGGTSDTM